MLRTIGGVALALATGLLVLVGTDRARAAEHDPELIPPPHEMTPEMMERAAEEHALELRLRILMDTARDLEEAGMERAAQAVRHQAEAAEREWHRMHRPPDEPREMRRDRPREEGPPGTADRLRAHARRLYGQAERMERAGRGGHEVTARALTMAAEAERLDAAWAQVGLLERLVDRQERMLRLLAELVREEREDDEHDD